MTTIPSQAFTNVPSGRSVVVEETEPTHSFIHLLLATDGGVSSVLLTPAQTQALAAALTARVELLERR